MSDPKIIVALDFPSWAGPCQQLVEQLDPTLCRVKVGKELFTAEGPSLLDGLHSKGFQVFLDLKFHDIPSTTAKAVLSAARQGVWMVNVHASGGVKMMSECADRLAQNQFNTKLIAVTVLTSFSEEEYARLGLARNLEEHVLYLAQMAKEANLDGVVCSPHEVTLLRNKIAQPFSYVTPGVRPHAADLGDQSRVMTPVEAIEAGSSYLVIGRPITQADDPLTSLQDISQSIQPRE